MKLDLQFPHSYEVEINPELPGNAGIFIDEYDYPGETKVGLVSLSVGVKPNTGRPWIGRFYAGYDSPHALRCVLSCINPITMCVVASGRAHIIPVSEPSRSLSVDMFPVIEAYRIPEIQRILFSDFWHVSAFDSDGEVWRSERLAVDGLKITSVAHDRIEGLTYDPFTDKWTQFVLDSATGNRVK